MTGIRSQWLELTREAVLEPELSLCDPHHHHWDYPSSRYLLEELVEDIGEHRVERTVFVECGSMYSPGASEALAPVGETRFVRDLAAQPASAGHGLNSAIVGHANLLLGDAVDEVLAAHVAEGAGRFRGIRHSASWDPSDAIHASHSKPPPHMLLDADFRRGFARLRAHDLSFDAWCYHPQIPELTDLAGAFPDTQIILDHVGGPLGIGPYAGKREEVFEAWRASITELSARPNVVVKLGGLAMKICGFDFHRAAQPPGSEELARITAPYYRHCIEVFGPDRCMFESNFPVDKVSASYTVVWNSFKRMTAQYSDDERAALLRQTARRVYRI